jgi:hypothetical protein
MNLWTLINLLISFIKELKMSYLFVVLFVFILILLSHLWTLLSWYVFINFLLDCLHYHLEIICILIADFYLNFLLHFIFILFSLLNILIIFFHLIHLVYDFICLLICTLKLFCLFSFWIDVFCSDFVLLWNINTLFQCWTLNWYAYSNDIFCFINKHYL